MSIKDYFFARANDRGDLFCIQLDYSPVSTEVMAPEYLDDLILPPVLSLVVSLFRYQLILTVYLGKHRVEKFNETTNQERKDQ